MRSQEVSCHVYVCYGYRCVPLSTGLLLYFGTVNTLLYLFVVHLIAHVLNFLMVLIIELNAQILFVLECSIKNIVNRTVERILSLFQNK